MAAAPSGYDILSYRRLDVHTLYFYLEQTSTNCCEHRFCESCYEQLKDHSERR